MKLELDYNSDGQLSQSRQNQNGVLQTYVDYTYESGVLKHAKSFSKMQDGIAELLAETDFTYSKQRLAGVEINFNHSSQGSKSTFYYNFSYDNNDNPTVTVSQSGVPFNYNFDTDGINFEDYSPIGEQNTTSQLTAKYDFDNKSNPLRGLPLIMSVRLNSLSAMQSTRYLHLFDSDSFFQANNVTKQTIGAINSFISYTYNQQGLPVKSVKTTNIINAAPTRLETTFEYW